MPGSSGDKLCPICDSPLQPGSKKCGFCGTDLTIFDIDTERPGPTQEPAPAARPEASRSVDSRVQEVMSSPTVPPAEPVSSEERAATASSLMPEAEKEPEEPSAPVAEEVPVKPEVSPQADDQHFECPECGTRVGITATTCPGCGGIFAEEGAEMFECPACKTQVAVDAKSCPGCGAMFVESEEPTAEGPAAEEAGPAEMEPPVSMVPSQEPQMKVTKESEPAPEPQPAPSPVESEDLGLKGRMGLGWLKRKKKAEDTVPGAEEPSVPGLAPSRGPPAERPSPDAKDKGKELARQFVEMKGILKLANDRDIDITEAHPLIDEAANAGRDRQLDRALELVNRSKALLTSKIDAHLTSALAQIKDEAQVAQELGGDVSRAKAYTLEVEKAKSAGDAEAAFVYIEKASKELLPITGRYKDAKRRIDSLRTLVMDCEVLLLDTKDTRTALSEAGKAFDAKDFDRVEGLVKQATDRLYRMIPDRMDEEMQTAKRLLIEAKMKNVNTTPFITILKSVRTLMKAGDYPRALREMRDFKDQIKKVT